MKTTLSKKELVFIASMLFGLFFGAGNLIFPIYMGQLAGRHMWQATIGFLITGVGLPLMGVAAMGISRSNGLIELSGKVSRGYSVFFTLRTVSDPYRALLRHPALRDGAVYRRRDAAAGHRCRIGGGACHLLRRIFPDRPGFFPVPGQDPDLGRQNSESAVSTVLGRPRLVAALVNPIGEISSIAPDGSYVDKAFSTGFLEGYNTMDALASLAFGIIVIDVIRGLGMPRDPRLYAKEYRQGRCVQLLADGTDLSGSDGRRRPRAAAFMISATTAARFSPWCRTTTLARSAR